MFRAGAGLEPERRPRLRGWASASGGLLWHARALRYRRAWQPFVEGLEQWLQDWETGTDALLLLGPSAGWCMPQSFLSRFRVIDAVDLDPLAPRLFGLNHGDFIRRNGICVNWARQDILQVLDLLLAKHPDHAVLFCNLLGQTGLHVRTESRLQAFLGGMPTRMRERPWASFHDRLSATTQDPAASLRPFCSRHGLDELSLVRLLPARFHSAPWVDHMTRDVLAADCPRLYLPWQLLPGQLHLIEAGHASRHLPSR